MWDWNEWKRKMHRRVKTLLIPYLIWVTLYIVYVYFHQCRLSSVAGKGWIQPTQWFSDNGGFRMWWDSIVTENSHPLGYKTVSAHPFHRVLWFVRDLMVINLLSPAIHWALRKGGRWSLMALLVLNILQIWPPLHSVGVTCVFYYCTGAYLAIQGKRLYDLLSKRKVLIWLFTGTLLVPMVVFRQSEFYAYAKPIWCIFGAISFVNLVALFTAKRLETKIVFLSESTFFIYVTHSVILSNIRQALLELPPIHLGEVTVFLLTGVITICVCLLLYWLMRRYLPQTCTLICGR